MNGREGNEEKRVPTPKEQDIGADLPLKLTPQLPRWQFGSKTEHPCPRPATVKRGLSAICEEHVRTAALAPPVDHWPLADEIISDWLEIARAREHDDLVRLAEGIKAEAELELAKTRAKLEGAPEPADRARK